MPARARGAAGLVLILRGISDRGLAALAFGVCLALALAQFALIGRIELTFDEAYYALWSRDLAWGYFDHPPVIAAWIRASTGAVRRIGIRRARAQCAGLRASCPG